MNYVLELARKGEESREMELKLARETSQGPSGIVAITMTVIEVGNYEVPTVWSVLIDTDFSFLLDS